MSHGANLFNMCPFPDSPALYPIWTQFIPNRSSRLTTFPRLLNCWTLSPQMPPRGIGGRIVFGYVQFQMNPQMCTEFDANRSFRLAYFPDLNVWPPKAPCPKYPCGIEGRIVFSLCPFPDESTDVYRICCQSLHPFGSFPRLNPMLHGRRNTDIFVNEAISCAHIVTRTPASHYLLIMSVN